MQYLSKSDFLIAQSCPTKLYYKKKGYPNSADQNEYMEYLAEGGYMVGKLATLLYPEGIHVSTDRDHQKSIRLTEEHLKEKNVTLFEAAIESKGKLIRVDILEKKGNTINLIEVKSKSFTTTDDPKEHEKVIRGLKDYILDVAYQYYVLSEKYPEYKIKPFLFMPDKAKRTKVEGLNHLFNAKKVADNKESKFRSFEVSVDLTRIDDILNDDIMTLVDLEDEVMDMQEYIAENVKDLLKSLKNGISKIEKPIDKNCFKCEFQEKDDNHSASGYDECWKDMPEPEHHIRDLYYGGTLGGSKDPYYNEMIRSGELSIFDVPIDLLKGKRGERQLIQIQNTKENKEWFDPKLKDILDSWEYPLHFIDFETSLHALPFHKNMRPYETVAFQWSCHTIKKKGGDLIHSEWLNLEPEFPNFKFAESLMEQIGLEGTPLMWSSYENTILRQIYEQFEVYNYSNPELKNWLENIVKLDKDDTGSFIDMNKLTLEYYFHPMMKGKTSIKCVLPAVMSCFKSPRIQSWLENFEDSLSLFEKTDDGTVVSPYKLLPPIDMYDEAESVKDGTGAMLCYADLMFGIKKVDLTKKENYERALKRYCKLDTLAMVIIWEHWV